MNIRLKFLIRILLLILILSTPFYSQTYLNPILKPDSRPNHEFIHPQSNITMKFSDDYSDERKPKIINGISVPKDMPLIEPYIMTDRTSAGKIFMSIMDDSRPYIMVFENDGTPYFYRRVERRTRDFKPLLNGYLARMITKESGMSAGWEILDSNYNHLKILNAQNGLVSDDHEFKITEEGTYLIGARDYRKIGTRTLTDNVVQEINEDGEVILQWHSKDYIDPSEAVHSSGTTGDYVHLNSIAVDYDNNIVISCRNLSQCIKISRDSGEIIWRLGGVKNDFEFVNDEYGISYQHSFEPVPGKPNHYTVFDNGNFRNPTFSRAVEFKLDTDSMKAEKVWEYRSEPDFYSSWMGNVQRLPNGNTLVNWASSNLPKPTEISPEGEVVYEAQLNYRSNVYRVFKYDWEGFSDTPYLIIEPEQDFLRLIFNKFGDNSIAKYKLYFEIEDEGPNLIDTTINPYYIIDYDYLTNHKYAKFFISALDTLGNESGFSNAESLFINYFDDGENLIVNGDFSAGLEFWDTHVSDSASAEFLINEAGQAFLDIEDGGENNNDVKLIYTKIPLYAAKEYLLEFDAYSSYNRLLEINVEKKTPPFTNYSKIGSVQLTRNFNHFTYKFKMISFSDTEANLVIRAGNNDANIAIDNISLRTYGVTNIIEEEEFYGFKLKQNYPNPFNPTTKIEYRIPRGVEKQSDSPFLKKVTLNIFNNLGQKLSTLVDKRQKPGSYHVVFDGSLFTSGVYYYQLKVDKFRQTRKMILLK